VKSGFESGASTTAIASLGHRKKRKKKERKQKNEGDRKSFPAPSRKQREEVKVAKKRGQKKGSIKEEVGPWRGGGGSKFYGSKGTRKRGT